jgi:L-iditol 2-dehydrogenase
MTAKGFEPMKAVVYYDENTIRYEDVPKPAVRDGEILVRMRACGICGGDLMRWYKKKAPVVLGHEITGEVVELGKGVENLSLGERVVVHHHAPCFSCHYCVHGDYVHCDRFSKNRIEPGGFAEYIGVSAAIARHDVLPLPDSISFEYGTLVEPLACCVKAMGRANLRPGDAVGVIGAGTVGVMNVALAKKTMGAGRVVVSDTLENRRSFAKRFGADVVVDPVRESFGAACREATGGIGVDTAIVAVSGSRALSEGIEAVRSGGTVVIFAPPAPGDTLPLDANRLYFTEKTLVSSYTASHLETRRALRLMESGAVDLRPMITRRFEMGRAAEAFRLAESREGLKVLITNEK